MMFLQKYRVIQWVILLLAFLLPIHPRFVPPILLLLAITNWVLPYYFSKVKEMLRSFPFWIFVGFYLIYFFGLWWTSTEGKSSGWSNVETKLAFLAMPIIFWTISIRDLPEKEKIKKYFILGAICSLLICTGFGVYHLIDERIDMANGITRDNFRYYWFFSDRLSLFIHPTYLSMYVNLALAFLLLSPKKNYFSGFIFWTILVILFVGIFMLASKAGLITFGLLMIVFTWRLIFIENKIWNALTGLTVVVALFFFAYFSIGEFRNKIQMAIHAVKNSNQKQTADESSAMRVEVWKAAVDVVEKNFLIGTGTGDARQELLQAYKVRGLDAEVNRQLNSHNQFLQTTIAVGILGLLILLLWMFTFSILFFRAGERDGMWIMLLFLINNLVECMLEVEAGVLFFTFFISLFYCYIKMERSKS